MIFWASVGIIFVISFILALSSLFREISKPKHLKKINEHRKNTIEKHKLPKEKVLFEKT